MGATEGFGNKTLAVFADPKLCATCTERANIEFGAGSGGLHSNEN